MRLIPLALLAVLPWMAQAAPTWQVISSEPGKRIELDRTSIKREDGGKVVALGRIILEKELTDARSGSTYRIIEALTRYDCAGRNAATVKRTYRKDESELLREEEINGGNLPVRSGTLDEKVFREVCRPASSKAEAQEIAKKAGEAAGKLRAANEALVQKEVAKAANSAPLKTANSGHATATPSVHKDTVTPAKAEAPTASRKPVEKAEPTAHVVSKKRGAHKPKKGDHPAGEHDVANKEHPHWSYEGEGAPENWYKLDPKNKLCASGQRQSPIDIRDGIKVDLEPIKFNYSPSLFHIVDNGHTVQVAVGGGSLTLTGKTYQLLQFHFHKPSEEKINGQRYEMVAHLVHKSDDGHLAVVAVLFERGAENPVIQTLWNNLPLEKNIIVSPPSASIDLTVLLPGDRAYFTYMGSLTTPPCTEGVLWLVLKQPVAISVEQLNIFARLYRDNTRPIQRTSDRLIKEGR